MMKRTFAMTTVCIALSACKPPMQQPASDAKWGHLESAVSQLISVPPRGKIQICVPRQFVAYTAYIKKAVNTWAATIGRDKWLDTVESCEHSESIPDASIELTVGKTSDCADSSLAYQTHGPQFGKFSSLVINVCKESWTSREAYAVILHEVGHAWGLCDQYDLGGLVAFRRGVFHDNCTTENRSQVAGKGVMAAAYFWSYSSPQADDIAGMKSLAERTDLPMNAIWQKFLAGSPQASGAAGTIPDDLPGIDRASMGRACQEKFANAPENSPSLSFPMYDDSNSLRNSYKPGDKVSFTVNWGLAPEAASQLAVITGLITDAAGGIVFNQSSLLTSGTLGNANFRFEALIPATTPASQWNAYICKYVIQGTNVVSVDAIHRAFQVSQ